MKNIDEIVATTLATTKTPLALSDDTWAQATYYTGRYNTNVDTNVYAKFLDSIKERDAKVNAFIISALSFLHKKGYITQEEYENRKSERLNDIRTYDRSYGMDVMLSFDEDEWVFYVEVDSTLKVKSVIFNDGKENESQVLYGGKPFHFTNTK